MPHAAAMRWMELLGKEVIPAIKGYQPNSDARKGFGRTSHETGTL